MRLRVGIVGILTAILLTTAPAALLADGGGVPAPVKHSWVLIDQDYKDGKITLSESVMYGIYAMYQPELLPEEYRVEEPDILLCGTPIIQRGILYQSQLTNECKSTLRGATARPSNQTYIDTGNYRVHFDTLGSEQVQGWPSMDYVNVVADAAEFARVVYHDSLGMLYPPSDGTAGGGSGLIDIYLKELSGGLYGYAVAELGIPSTPWEDRAGYFVVDRDLGGDERVKSTTVHELQHITQYAYDYQEISAFMEGGAVWAEDMVYDDINDYIGYIVYFQSEPYRSLCYDGQLYVYGSSLWYFYLHERFDRSFITRMYEDTRDYGTPFQNEPDYFDATRSIMENEYGITLEEAFTEWPAWRFLVGSNDDGEHFSEAEFIPPVMPIPDGFLPEDYPISGAQPSELPGPFGSAFIRFKCDDTVGGLLLEYDGIDSQNWGSTIITVSDDGTEFNEWWQQLDALGLGSDDICDWDQYKRVMCSINNLGRESFDPDTSYIDGYIVEFSATYDSADTCGGTSGVPDLDRWQEEGVASRIVSVSPNPISPNTTIGFAITEQGEKFDLALYDVQGRLVTILSSGSQAPGIYSATWDGTDAAGRKVSSGVYFAKLRTSTGTDVRKVVVAR